MTEYNAYGELYDQRPDLIIHERLKHNGSIKELIDIARSKNFNVYFDRGPLHQDTVIKWHEETGKRPEGHSVSSAMRYFKRLSS